MVYCEYCDESCFVYSKKKKRYVDLTYRAEGKRICCNCYQRFIRNKCLTPKRKKSVNSRHYKYNLLQTEILRAKTKLLKSLSPDELLKYVGYKIKNVGRNIKRTRKKIFRS